MILLLLLLLLSVFSMGQLVLDNGVRTFRDVSFWLILVSGVAIATFILGGV